MTREPLDPGLKVNFIVRQGEGGELRLHSQPVPEVRDELLPWVEKEEVLPVKGRLLE